MYNKHRKGAENSKDQKRVDGKCRTWIWRTN